MSSLLTPHPLSRGDSVAEMEGQIVGAIGAFSDACIAGETLHQPLEVLLVEGHRTQLFARVGDSHHQVHEGRLTSATVSYTLEAFSIARSGDPLTTLQKDSACLRLPVTGNLHAFILETAQRQNVTGALLHIRGRANGIHTYGHTDIHHLNDTTKTFDQTADVVGIEGWGNLTLIDGKKPFVHLHGTYEARGQRKGGHFIMDDATQLMIDQAELLIYPVPNLVRRIQSEDFPSWVTDLEKT